MNPIILSFCFIILSLFTGATALQAGNSDGIDYQALAENKEFLNQLIARAKKGNARYQYQLANIYDTGMSSNSDVRKAVYWLIKSAGGGYAPAQHSLATHYFTGRGIKANPARGIHWLERAAEQSNQNAMRDLGFLYYRGEHVKKNYLKALRLLALPAEMGDEQAAYWLGEIFYQGGYGIKQNRQTAIDWFIKSAEGGNLTARSRLQDIDPNIKLKPVSVARTEPRPAVGTGQETSADSHADFTEKVSEALEKIDAAPVINGDDAPLTQKIETGVTSSQSAERQEKAENATTQNDVTVQQQAAGELADAETTGTQAMPQQAVNATVTQNSETIQPASSSPVHANTESGSIVPGHDISPNQTAAAKPGPLASKTIAVNEKASVDDLFSDCLERFRRIDNQHYVIQLISASKRETIVKLMDRHYDDNTYYLETMGKNNTPAYLLIYGDYKDRESARLAAENLPEGLRFSTPWIRRVNNVTAYQP